MTIQLQRTSTHHAQPRPSPEEVPLSRRLLGPSHPSTLILALVLVLIPTAVSAQWLQAGPDIDGEAEGDGLGHSVSVSSDGTRVAIGAPYSDANGSWSGQVRVFEWAPSTSSWVQMGPALNGEAMSDQSGDSVSLSSDGTRVAIGAPKNSGNGFNSGHVRIYSWNGWYWVQQGEDIDGEATGDQCGTAISLSSDGLFVAMGAPANDGNGDWSGHVRVFGNDLVFEDGFESGDMSAWSSAIP